MRRTYAKNVRRTISGTRGRFIAIFAIVLLGVGFLSGLLSATPDMRASFDSYFDSANLYDLEILGGLGFTDGDADALKKVDGVESVQSGYIADALLKCGESEYAVRMRSWDESDTLNVPSLVSGRMPSSADECVVVNVMLGASSRIKLGDTLSLSDNDKNASDLLECKKFTVVGFINDSLNYSSETEYTNIGSGKLDLFIRVPKSSFVQDCYTEMFMTVNGAKPLTALSTEYNDLVKDEASSVKSISAARCQTRYDEVKSDADEKLADADEKYQNAVDEANSKLADAKAKLDDGQKKLADGKKQLADGKKQLADKEKELKDGEADYYSGKADTEKQLADAKQKLDDAQADIDSGRAQAESGLSESSSALAAYKLTASQNTAFGALRALPEKYPTLADDMQSLQKDSARLAEIQARLSEIASSGDSAAAAAEKQSLIQEMQQLQSEAAAIQSGAGYQAFAAGTQSLAAAGAASYQELANLALRMGALDAALARLDAAQSQLDAQSSAFAQQKVSAEKSLSDARAKLDAGEKALSEAKATLRLNESKLTKSEATLASAQKEYDDAKADTEKKLADAKKTLDDSRDEITNLKVPSWTVSTRMDNSSCASLNSNIDKVESIAKVFPFFFFLVAALVSLTTMTRMVEDERLQIGTMKALGYSRGTIMGKYIVYALTASVLGSVVGFAIGYRLFPAVIWNCYTMMYVMPGFRYLLIWPYALGTSGAVIAFILIATIAVCSSTLREKPAQLMLPKAPDPGKRVLLERITPIWSRMKFTHKVTARNLFRYKKRLAMTVIGVAGCTALLVTGFGLRDSFSAVASRQYGSIFTYDTLAVLTGDSPLQDEDLVSLLGDKSTVSGSASVSYQSVTAKSGGHELEIYTFIPEKCSDLSGFVDLHVRQSGKPITFESGSVVMTEKASELLGLRVGDSFTLEDSDGKTGAFTLSGISENYVSNFVFMDSATYSSAMSATPEMNALTVKLAADDPDSVSAFDKAAFSTGAVAGVINANDTRNTVESEIDKINYIVVVVIICAALLAFVVLYNLTNINIEERVKEIATLKVLGFTDRETRSYVSRESIILTAIGCAFGLVLGIFLHRYVMGQAEMDIIMFGRSVYPMSFVYSAALTMAFGFLVDFILGGKLRKISMVESMKAPE